ncbi:MAG: NF038122 family metalloprotease [Candidatus Synoicihabitans palmerolidicus]|nr:NF038122 family metalloprotease [Candidatus Synoicihabitans palmerolidicus]
MPSPSPTCPIPPATTSPTTTSRSEKRPPPPLSRPHPPIRLIVTQTQLRALGSSDTYDNPDASITFSSDFSFDFDRSDGITASQYDFVGVAAHEIGHALGFTSVVDTIDANSANPLDAANVAPTGLDLFRFSAEGQRDISAGIDAFLSIDNGLTSIGGLSTGVVTGNGRQASHWLDNLGIGIMDPTLATGELAVISLQDLQALDVIGWSVGQFSAVPEPAASGAIAGWSISPPTSRPHIISAPSFLTTNSPWLPPSTSQPPSD